MYNYVHCSKNRVSVVCSEFENCVFLLENVGCRTFGTYCEIELKCTKFIMQALF